jgi:glycerol kinase
VKWILDNIEGAQEKADQGDLLFGTIDSWLVWNLTGGAEGGKHITDVTNASRTMLMDLETLTWDQDILEILEIPQEMLPKIRSSSEKYGEMSTPWPGIPIAGILGDQQAALFGQTCYKKGEAKNTYGTGCFLLLNTGQTPIISKSGLITTIGYQIGGQEPVYALEGSIAIAGALVQWLRDNIGMIEKSSEIEVLAKEVEDNGGVYFVPAFSGLYAPYWRSDARGLIVGLTRYVEKAHIARATLEATAYQTKEILEAMEEDSGVKLKVLKVDGGMVVNELLMQFQADVLDVPVIRPTITETTSLGAAYAVGLALGFWDDLSILREKWKADKQWTPNMTPERRQELIHFWHKAVERSFGWIEEGGN